MCNQADANIQFQKLFINFYPRKHTSLLCVLCRYVRVASTLCKLHTRSHTLWANKLMMIILYAQNSHIHAKQWQIGENCASCTINTNSVCVIISTIAGTMMLLLIHVDVAHIESAQNLHEEDEGKKERKKKRERRKGNSLAFHI